jgi:aryl-alcohol dehydrogenase-like predicted oxidoreductase
MNVSENINLRQLGQSDMRLSPVGLGCLQMSRGSGIAGIMWPTLGTGEVRDIVRASIAGGINWFDTAELYGWGESERALSDALESLKVQRDGITVATKWWPLFRTAGSITSTIDKRLECLRSQTIDLYQIHNPFSFSPISSQMKAMARLVEEGKVRYIGVSNFSAKKMRKAYKELSNLGLPLVSNQMSYSLIDRRIESNGVLETAQELGVSVIAYSPLGRGLLTGKFHDKPGLIKKRHILRRFYASLNKRKLETTSALVGALKTLSKKYQVTPSQAALNWVINSNGDCVFAIAGATKTGQAEDNAASMKFELSRDDLDYLGEMSAPFK